MKQDTPSKLQHSLVVQSVHVDKNCKRTNESWSIRIALNLKEVSTAIVQMMPISGHLFGVASNVACASAASHFFRFAGLCRTFTIQCSIFARPNNRTPQKRLFGGLCNIENLTGHLARFRASFWTPRIGCPGTAPRPFTFGRTSCRKLVSIACAYIARDN